MTDAELVRELRERLYRAENAPEKTTSVDVDLDKRLLAALSSGRDAVIEECANALKGDNLPDWAESRVMNVLHHLQRNSWGDLYKPAQKTSQDAVTDAMVDAAVRAMLDSDGKSTTHYPHVYARLARAALEAALSTPKPPVEGEGWRDIESAPKDEFILLWSPEDQSRWLAKWQGGYWYGVDDCGLSRCSSARKITAWRPIPTPPNLRDGEGKDNEAQAGRGLG